MMFTIENTPKSNNYLKKGLDKLRSSTRKSPAVKSRKSPAQSARKENLPSGKSRTGALREGKTGSFKSPQVSTKGLKKSPQATSRSAKPQGLTASARKVNAHTNSFMVLQDTLD